MTLPGFAKSGKLWQWPVLIKLSAVLWQCLCGSLVKSDELRHRPVLDQIERGFVAVFVAVSAFIRSEELRHRPVFDLIERGFCGGFFVAVSSLVKSDELRHRQLLIKLSAVLWRCLCGNAVIESVHFYAGFVFWKLARNSGRATSMLMMIQAYCSTFEALIVAQPKSFWRLVTHMPCLFHACLAFFA